MAPRKPTIVRPNDLFQLEALFTDGLHALDLETTGLHRYAKIVGIGLANHKHLFYIDFLNSTEQTKLWVLTKLKTLPLIAHNTVFDQGILYGATGHMFNFVGCSQVLFKLCSTEGWTGQRWGLGVAVEDVLGWDVSQKDTMDDLLKKHKLAKGDMWQLGKLEPEAFADYCRLDAEACWQLWHYLMDVTSAPELLPIQTWAQQEYRNLIELFIEQYFRGIIIDEPALLAVKADVLKQASEKHQAFLAHPQVAEHIAEYNRRELQKVLDAEPPKFTMAGKPAAAWGKWAAKAEAARNTQHFNVNSAKQLTWLFFNKLYETERVPGKEIRLNNGQVRKFPDQLKIYTDDRTVLAETTATGAATVSKDVLPQLGPAAQELSKYRKLLKQHGYVDAVAHSLENGILHPQLRPHGSYTGRSGGGGGSGAKHSVNPVQQPKLWQYLKTWRARPGHKLVQIDHTAAEPVVLTNASQDSTMLTLYGPEAKPNDIYLFVAAHTTAFSAEVLKYYDPYNPTAISIELAKKECKKIRSISKQIQLSKTYGASPGKVWYILQAGGADIPRDTVQELCDDWDTLFAGTKTFAKKLERQWNANGGWIYNLLKRPIAVDRSKLRDLVSRFCQSSGHDILLKHLCHINRLRHERKVDMWPWLTDYHDETIWECRTEDAEAAGNILADALAATQDELRAVMPIPIKGTVEVVDTLADIKCEG